MSSTEDEVHELMRRHRYTATKAVESVESEPDGTVALAMMLTGLSHGLEDALALLAHEIDANARA
jgi:hypothetical protein